MLIKPYCFIFIVHLPRSIQTLIKAETRQHENISEHDRNIISWIFDWICNEIKSNVIRQHCTQFLTEIIISKKWWQFRNLSKIVAKSKIAEKLTQMWGGVDKKLTKTFGNVFTFSYFSRSFQWCSLKCGIGNGFGVKPKNHFFTNFQNCFFCPNPKTMGSYFFLVLVVRYGPCKQSKPKHRFEKSKMQAWKVFLENDQKRAQYGQIKKSIFSEVSHANTSFGWNHLKDLAKTFLEMMDSTCQRIFNGSQLSPKNGRDRRYVGCCGP